VAALQVTWRQPLRPARKRWAAARDWVGPRPGVGENKTAENSNPLARTRRRLANPVQGDSRDLNCKAANGRDRKPKHELRALKARVPRRLYILPGVLNYQRAFKTLLYHGPNSLGGDEVGDCRANVHRHGPVRPKLREEEPLFGCIDRVTKTAFLLRLLLV